MSIVDVARKRYATKAFDPNRSIPPEIVADMKELLRNSPSSVNGQPWHFLIAETAEAKKRVAKAATGPFAYNAQKILNASHVVVFCNRTELDEAYLVRLIEQENADGRYRTTEGKNEQHVKRRMYVDLHKDGLKDLPHWTAKQVYLNLGAFLLGVAVLGLDAVPIEGFDQAVLDQEFSLSALGCSSAAIVPVGYHAVDDFNASLPKSRFPLEDIITIV